MSGKGKIYFAPLEGIAGYIFRNAFNDVFEPEIEKYFSPFISPGPRQSITNKELRDILPENNSRIKLIPQVLTNSAEDFLALEKRLKDMGYDELNVNLGCPSGTVVSKKRGAGLLADIELLERMLDGIYSKTEVLVSLKTRLGMENSKEFEKLLELYNKFPIHELIIHPRVRAELYKGSPDMESFDMAVHNSHHRICYNGDICTKSDYDKIVNKYPKLSAVMIGRGFLRNPMLIHNIQKSMAPDKEKIKSYHDLVLERYSEVMYGERPVLFKMKELWAYMLDLFEDSEKYAKKIKKASNLSVYNSAVNELFEFCCIKEN